MLVFYMGVKLVFTHYHTTGAFGETGNNEKN